MPRHPFAEWSAEQIRLTVFPTPGANGHIRELMEHWWEVVVALPPDETSSNPRRGSKSLTGTFGSGKLALKLEPDRMDWLWAPPIPEPGAVIDEFLVIGPVIESLDAFFNLAERWLTLADTPEIGRMAFGAILNHPEQDRRSGYLRIPDYVPIRIDPESSDFFFQINVPTDSNTRIDGLRINRLSRWSVAALAHMSIGLRLAETGIVPGIPAVIAYALRIELDINTAQEFQGPLPRARLVEVFRELVATGRQLVTEGLER